MKTKVLIIDDSALMRQLLTEILSRDPGLEVIGAASDPLAARDKILRMAPDVITLDVEMPRMDGLTFLEKLMRAHPLPVVMVSSLTERGCDTTWRALELGATDFVTKPKLDVQSGTMQLAQEIIDKVKAAARAKVRFTHRGALPKIAPESTPSPAPMSFRATHKVVAIGASTGGTEAIREVLTKMPADAPGIVMVQHMPEKFTASFAERLNSLSKINVSEARDGRPCATRSCAAGAGQLPHGGNPQRRRVPRARIRRRPGKPAPALGRCAFRVLRPTVGRQRGGRNPHRYGRGLAPGRWRPCGGPEPTPSRKMRRAAWYSACPRKRSPWGGAAEVLPLERISFAILRAVAA